MSPFLSDVLIAFTAASSARPAAAFEMSACRAIASIISDLFTRTPLMPLADAITNAGAQPFRARRSTDRFPCLARSVLDDGSAAVRRRRGRHRLFGLFLFFGQRHWLGFERLFQHLLDPTHRMDVKTILDLVRNFDAILHVLFRNQHRLDATPTGGQQFLL